MYISIDLFYVVDLLQKLTNIHIYYYFIIVSATSGVTSSSLPVSSIASLLGQLLIITLQ